MIICGGYHTVIKDKNNEIYVCGCNIVGQLGLGDNINRDKFEKVNFDFGEIKNISCGKNHTIIQNEKNEIYVCGDNGHGQLGLGDNIDRKKFKKVEKNFGEIKRIACGANHTVIQNEENEIYVCGLNWDGQLGLGDNYNRNKFEKVEYDFGEIKKTVCGSYYTVIQNEKNEVCVCGANECGQLGLGDDEDIDWFGIADYDFKKIKNIACGENHTVIQNEEYIEDEEDEDWGDDIDVVYVCGCNDYGQLGLGDHEFRKKFEKVEYNFGGIKNIACGENHIVIQNEENEIYVCGLNENGQLGLGDNINREIFEKVNYNFGEIKNIVCGGYHIVIQNKKNEIYVCGYNEYGQLGLGDYNDRNIFEKVDIFEKIYNLKLELNTKEIAL